MWCEATQREEGRERVWASLGVGNDGVNGPRQARGSWLPLSAQRARTGHRHLPPSRLTSLRPPKPPSSARLSSHPGQRIAATTPARDATALSNNDGHRGRRRCIRRRLGKPAGGQFPALVLLRRQAQRCHPIQASTWLGRARQARAHRSRSMVFRGPSIALRLAQPVSHHRRRGWHRELLDVGEEHEPASIAPLFEPCVF